MVRALRHGLMLGLMMAAGGCLLQRDDPDGIYGDEAGGAGGDGGFTHAGGQPAGGAFSCDGPGSVFVTEVVSVHYGSGQSFGQDQMPDIVLGPPHGGGCCAGSTDVVALGNGGEIVVAFGGNGIIDGPGPDLVVFENPFQIGGDPDHIYAELATVAVSADGIDWIEFSCEATSAPYGTCAGHTPVMLDGSDSLDGETCGGDLFDLSDIDVDFARYVRITDRADLAGTVFDLDAVGILNPACP